MNERKRDQAGSDGVCWYCTTCKTTKSIHCNSFFSKSKLTLRQWFLLILWCAREYPVCAAATEAEVTEATSCQVYQWLQEVYSTTLLQTRIVLGGPKGRNINENNLVVLILELLFQHHRGRGPRQDAWVFGIVDTSHTPALGFMQLVQTRDAATFLPIIRDHVAPGTIVHSVVANLQPGSQSSTSCHTSDSKSLCQFCRPNDWGSYPTC